MGIGHMDVGQGKHKEIDASEGSGAWKMSLMF